MQVMYSAVTVMEVWMMIVGQSFVCSHHNNRSNNKTKHTFSLPLLLTACAAVEME
jgi:hypothetical protein